MSHYSLASEQLFGQTIRQVCLVGFAVAAILVVGIGDCEAAIVSQFTFDDNTADDSVDGNDGTFVGTAAVVTDATRGQVLSVDGNSDYTNHADAANLDITSAISLTAWFNKTDSNDGSLVVKELSSSAGYGLEANPTGLRFFLFGSGNSNLDNAGSYSNNTWNHAAGTWDGTTARAYVNGIEVASAAYSGPITTNNDPLRIGHGQISGNSQNYFGGLIDDVGVYNSGLTGEEVALIHGLGRFAEVNQTDSEIAAAQSVFAAESGRFVTANNQIWSYASGLGSTTVGFTGGSVGGVDAFIVLDGDSNGVQLVGFVPEPSTGLLLTVGLVGMAFRRRRHRA